jgi:hypothetical protein
MTVRTRLILRDGDLLVHSRQDVEAIVERNKALQGEPQKSDWGRHVATIPNNILLAWLQEEWARGNVNLKLFDAEFNRLVANKLKDRDWLFLRTD